MVGIPPISVPMTEVRICRSARVPLARGKRTGVSKKENTNPTPPPTELLVTLSLLNKLSGSCIEARTPPVTLDIVVMPTRWDFLNVSLTEHQNFYLCRLLWHQILFHLFGAALCCSFRDSRNRRSSHTSCVKSQHLLFPQVGQMYRPQNVTL